MLMASANGRVVGLLSGDLGKPTRPAFVGLAFLRPFRALHDSSHPLLPRHTLHDVTDAPQQSIAVEMHYGYRAVAFIDDAGRYVWYWCGSHAAYDTRFQAGR